jgi:hypothetical protein
MAITYPLVAPTSTIGPSAISFSLVTADALSGSPFTFKQQVINLGGSRWEASVTIPPVNKATAEVWISFLLSLKGRTGTFLLGDPMGQTQQGVYGGSLRSYGSMVADFTNGIYRYTNATFSASIDGAGQIGDSIIIKGLPINTANVFKPGDYIQIGTGSSASMHKILTTTDSTFDGRAVIDIAPALRNPSVDGAVILTSNAKCLFRLKDNAVTWSIDNALRYGISFDAVEALT